MGRPSGDASMGERSLVLIDTDFDSELETAMEPPAEPAKQAPAPIKPEEPVLPPPQVAPEIPEMRPGVDGGAADAAAWLASQSEAEHRGLPSTVEQPALTQEPGLPTPPSMPSPASAPAAASPAQSAADAALAQPSPTPGSEPAPSVTPPAALAAAPAVKGEKEGVTNPSLVQAPSPPLPAAPGTAPHEAEVGPEPKPDGEPEAAKPQAPEAAPDPKELEEGPKAPGPAREVDSQRPTVPLPTPREESLAPSTKDGKDSSATKEATPEAPQVEKPDDAAPTPANRADRGEPPRGRADAPDGAVPTAVQSPDATEPVETEPVDTEIETPSSPDLTPAADRSRPNEAASSLEMSTTSSASNPSAPSPPSMPSPGGTTPGDRPFERADRDVDPTSVAGVGEIRFGKVTARDGLEVLPARPRFSHTVRFTTLPRNPLVRVTFSRVGRVTKAEFVRGRSTGYPEVDGPLLTAMYRWTARGAKLREIGPTGVTMTFKVLLREERELGMPQAERELGREGSAGEGAQPKALPEDPDFSEPRP